MYSIEQLSELIDKALNNIQIPDEPKNLYGPIKYALSSGGKRLRPVFTLAACNAFSSTIEPAIFPSLAIEVFHNFTLVHDDIMDSAPTRRNQPTVFAKWGSNVAILSGDAMNVIAYQLLGKTNRDVLPNIFNIFNTVAIGVCEGQQMDMDFESVIYVSEGEYMKMIELKTAVLIKGALEIGATIGGAKATDIEKIGLFGKNLGLAFQLQDDLLDTFGDSNVFGKRIGGDIVSNKKTFLAVKGFNLAKGKQLELLNSFYRAETIDPETKIAGVKGIYAELGIREITEKRIDELYRNSLANIKSLSIPNESKQVLLSLAERVMDRKR